MGQKVRPRLRRTPAELHADAHPQTYTLEQVAQHTSPDSAWVVVEGGVYDVCVPSSRLLQDGLRLTHATAPAAPPSSTTTQVRRLLLPPLGILPR